MAFDIPKPYLDTEDLTEAELDTCFEYIETFFNSRQITGDYIAVASIPAECLEAASVTESKIDAEAVSLGKLAAAVVAKLVPTGAVSAFAGTSAPTGWLMCDGTAVNRTTYAALFAVIGEAHGEGDNSTTFNLPNYQGRFLRGVDGSAGIDTDKASRTTMATGGNPGNLVGSVQTSATKLPTNAFTMGTESATHTHTESVRGGNINDIGGGTKNIAEFAGSTTSSTESATHTHAINGGGDNETRPANANVFYIIKT